VRRSWFLLIALLHAAPALAADAGATPWWIWPIALFVLSLALGAVAVVAGVGGGVLFVPIVGGFFPFHLDFVRGAGLLLALCGALSAGPSLLRSGTASLRLAMPLALVGSIASIGGALIGFALPTDILEVALGATIIGVGILMMRHTPTVRPGATEPDALAAALGMHGVYRDPASGQEFPWSARRTPAGLAVFAVIGTLAGMFGLGAGWANVAALNLLMGMPLKLSVGTSGFMLSVVDTSAAWVYINRGAVLPLLVAPSIIGVMLGARIGVRLLRTVSVRGVRRLVVVLLLLAGLRAFLKGLGVWN
jgi:uncharacterized protein